MKNLLITPAWGSKDRDGNLLPHAEAKEQPWTTEPVLVVQMPGMSAQEAADHIQYAIGATKQITEILAVIDNFKLVKK